MDILLSDYILTDWNAKERQLESTVLSGAANGMFDHLGGGECESWLKIQEKWK